MIGVFDSSTGVLFPEKCIESFISEAQKRGAKTHFNEKVLAIQKGPEYQTVTTTKGQYRAKKLIVSAGAYVLELMKELSLPWKVELKGLCWLEPQKGFETLFKPEKLPVFRLVDTKKKIKIAGFPDMMGTGVKTPIRTKKSQKMTNLYQLDREVEGKEEKTVKEKVTTYMPKVFGRVNKVATCLVTKFPDKNFLIDFLPGNENVVLASPCSAHGFKFSAVIGEVVKDLALYGKSKFDLEVFSFRNKVKGNSKL